MFSAHRPNAQKRSAQRRTAVAQAIDQLFKDLSCGSSKPINHLLPVWISGRFIIEELSLISSIADSSVRLSLMELSSFRQVVPRVLISSPWEKFSKNSVARDIGQPNFL